MRVIVNRCPQKLASPAEPRILVSGTLIGRIRTALARIRTGHPRKRTACLTYVYPQRETDPDVDHRAFKASELFHPALGPGNSREPAIPVARLEAGL
jgi:hypothetical protein